MSATIARELRDDALAPGMDALVLNDQQARRGFNPDPSVNSAVETNALSTRCIDTVLDDPDLSGRHRDTLQLARRANIETDQHVGAMIELNGRERQYERRTVRTVEGVAAALQLPRDGIDRRRSSLAARLRPILDVTMDPAADPLAYVRAGRDLGVLLDAVPATTLRARGMRNELGDAKHTELLRLLDLLHREEAR